MAKSKNTILEMRDWDCSSVMRWGGGEEVIAYLTWDETRFYLWFEPTDAFTDFVEEQGDASLKLILDELRSELASIGVQEFGTLEAVNSYCEYFCGDNEPSFFYEDELVGICGA